MSDNPEQGPLTILEAVEAITPDADQAQPDAETEETPDVEPVESTDEATAKPDEEAAESETEDAPEDDADDADDQTDTRLDLDEYGNLEIPVTVNGETRYVDLKEAAKGYQLQADYSRKTQELAEARKSFEAESAAKDAELSQQRELLARLAAEQSDPEPDWVALAREDPLGYVEKKAEWDHKQAEKQKVMQVAQQRKAREDYQTRVQEAQLLFDQAPELRDPQAAADLIQGCVEQFGFPREMVENAVDHRILLMAKDALAYRKIKKADPATNKVVRKPPKVIKSGAPKGKAEVKASKDAALKKKLAGPQTIDAYVNAFFE